MLPTALLLLLILAPVSPPLIQDPAPPPSSALQEELWAAARAGDVDRVKKALDAGADVNAKTRYGVTALTFAADRGHVEVIKLLLDRGADVNAKDSFYGMLPINIAMGNGHTDAVKLLLERGSGNAGSVLSMAVQRGDVSLVDAALASKSITRANVQAALAVANRTKNTALVERLTAQLERMPAENEPTAVAVSRQVLQRYAGAYRNQSAGMTVTAALQGDQLTLQVPGQPPLTLVPTSETVFRAAEFDGITFEFAGRGGSVERLVVVQGGTRQTLERVTTTAAADATAAPPATAPEKPAETATKPDPDSLRPDPRTEPKPWPAFRGLNANGANDGQGAVVQWDVKTGQNIRWKTPIPGISNASPIVWGDRVFVVTAISSAGDTTFRTGLYGDVAPVNDLSEHTWKIFALDKQTGKVLWERTAYTGQPRTKRHTKASQANSTPVTDGKRVVAVFGSIGLIAAWDFEGKPLWTRELGVIDSGWFFDPEYQWGHASSPIIYGNTVIVQADQQKGSYLAAYDLDSGKEVWRTDRDEISTWGTPTLFRANGREQIVANGTKVRGYDPTTGKLLWTLGPNSEITVGTPVVGDELVYVTGGYPPVRPIYAVKPTASGTITISDDSPTPEALAWSNTREGTYIPTPLYYRGVLYTCNNNGILSAYEGKTGERIYRARIGGGGSFSASPVAADGRLYFANEDGDVFVVRAGKTYEELAKNEMDEVIMSTPAISDGLIVIRTMGHVYGIGQ